MKVTFIVIFISVSIILFSFYKGYISFMERKPLGLQTILDLVHMDLAYSHAVSLISIYFGLVIGILTTTINEYAALILAWHNLFRHYTFLMFITVTSMIRYIHIYHPWKLESLEQSDEAIRRCVYYSTSIISAIITVLVTLTYHNS